MFVPSFIYSVSFRTERWKRERERMITLMDGRIESRRLLQEREVADRWDSHSRDSFREERERASFSFIRSLHIHAFSLSSSSAASLSLFLLFFVFSLSFQDLHVISFVADEIGLRLFVVSGVKRKKKRKHREKKKEEKRMRMDFGRTRREKREREKSDGHREREKDGRTFRIFFLSSSFSSLKLKCKKERRRKHLWGKKWQKKKIVRKKTEREKYQVQQIKWRDPGKNETILTITRTSRCRLHLGWLR